MSKIFHLCLMSLVFIRLSMAQSTPLINAHAHNDYYHDRPLFEALEHGFTSIEIDVFQIGQELYVAHDRPKSLEDTPTIEQLYFKPLAKHIMQNGGEVYPAYNGPFYLMIDFKTDGETTYKVLKEKLPLIKKYLTTFKKGKIKKKPITIFISGNRPMNTILKEKKRFVAVDGRPADIGKGYTPAYMPVISDNFRKWFSWRGKGPISEEEFKKMKELADNIHKEGKRLRFWATPEREIIWETLLQAGVDLLNTDKLERLENFLKDQPKVNKKK